MVLTNLENDSSIDNLVKHTLTKGIVGKTSELNVKSNGLALSADACCFRMFQQEGLEGVPVIHPIRNPNNCRMYMSGLATTMDVSGRLYN